MKNAESSMYPFEFEVGGVFNVRRINHSLCLFPKWQLALAILRMARTGPCVETPG